MKMLAALLLLFGSARADEISTSRGAVRLTPIQHASFLLEAGGKTIYVDPAQGKYEGRPAADLILITDIHGDHLAPNIISRLQKPETVIYAPEAVAKTLPQAKVIRNGESRQWEQWTIEAVPMYNLTRGPQPGRLYHDRGRGNGYVLSYGGKRFYISGDTEDIPEMKALRNIDVAFLCMNLPYTMPPEEAARAVRAFHPKIVYPYHYGKSDLKVFEKGVAGTGIEVRLRNWYPAG